MNIQEVVGLIFTVTGNGRYQRTLEHDSLVLDTYKNTFYWNSKGFGGDVHAFITKILNFPKEVADMFAEPLKEYTPPKKELNQDLAFLFWEFGKDTRDFWYDRGFDDAVIDEYKLGYFGGNYTLPFFMAGKLKALILRGENKFISEVAGSQKSLFGLDNLKKRDILLVESPLDVPLLKRFGFDSISFTYGANAWDNSWDFLLEDYNVVVIPDNDSAGKHILTKLTFYAKVVSWPKNTPKGFDIGKLYKSNEEKFSDNVNYLIDKSIPINFLWQEKRARYAGK